MTPNQNRILALELADEIKRSWWVIVAGVCLGAAASEIALMSIRPVYESAAVVYADAQQLPREMVRTTVPDAPPELQLPVLRRSVLKRENIDRMVRERLAASEPPEVVETLIDQVTAGVAIVGNTDPRKPMLTISYRDTDPRRASRVANGVAELVVSANATLRAEKAAQVTNAIQSLSRGIEGELEAVSRQIRELRSRYPYQTDTQRSSNEAGLSKAQSDLEQVTKELEAARDRLVSFEAERAGGAASDGVPELPTAPATGSAMAIAELEAEIDSLRLRYKDTHPALQAKLLQLERLRRAGREVEDRPAATPLPTAAPQPFDFLQSHIRAARLEVERLGKEQKRLVAERDRYQSYLDHTPRVQEELDDLILRRNRLERDYQANQVKIDTARTGQQIEEEKLGNPFEIVAFARPSWVPAWPNRLQFLGGGIAGGLLLFVGPLLARRLLRPVICSEAGLRALGDVPVLAIIPTIDTPQSTRAARRARLRNWGLAGASMIVVAAAQAVRLLQ